MTAIRKPRLGAGVDALLSPRPVAVDGEQQSGSGLLQLALDQIRANPYQPRTEFPDESLKVLADSIHRQGVIQPIVVRRVGKQYELVAGERRLRAAQQAGLATVPAVVRELSDQDSAALALVENMQREDLNPIDKARGLKQLATQFDQTHEQIAETLSCARASVTNLIRVLDLCKAVQLQVQSEQISLGHAKLLVPLAQARQKEVAQAVVKEHLTVRATERLIKKLATPPGEPTPDPDLEHLQRDLGDHLGCPVVLRVSKKGSGRMQIGFSSHESLKGLLGRLGYRND